MGEGVVCVVGIEDGGIDGWLCVAHLDWVEICPGEDNIFGDGPDVGCFVDEGACYFVHGWCEGLMWLVIVRVLVHGGGVAEGNFWMAVTSSGAT